MIGEALVKCPNCGNVFDSNETFSWGIDSDGHPTIEQLYCPKCFIGTEPRFDCGCCPGQFKCNGDESCYACDSTSYDSFKEQDNAKNRD